MIEAYKDHAENHDKFEIIAIHDSSVKSFEELDRKLTKIKQKYWKGQDLPFPVMIDKDGITEKAYGISAHPTQILIAPDGNVVGESHLGLLEKELPELPAQVIWNRNADSQKNIHWSWGPEPKFKDLIQAFETWSRKQKIEIDPEIVEKTGLTPDAEMQFFMEGYGVTIRSISQLAFDPYGLSIQPNSDGTGLMLGKETRTDVPETPLQQQNNAYLRKRIATQKGAGDTDVGGPVEESGKKAEESKIGDLEIEELSLRDAMRRISNQFEIPVGINKTAFEQAGKLPVSGKIAQNRMRETIEEMIEPLGLKLIVKYELVLVVPNE